MRMERTVKAMKGMAEVDEEAEAMVLGVEMDVEALHSVQTRVRVEDLEALDVEEANLAVEEASHVVEVNLVAEEINLGVEAINLDALGSLMRCSSSV